MSTAANSSWEELSSSVTIREDGFLKFYVVNESDADVWFDDFSIEHIESPIAQQTDYYPFGLAINVTQYNRNTWQQNQYLYNGKELQNETQWYDYGARHYDPQLGRFFAQDRFAEKYYALTPYQYGANNPILFVDINGDSLQISGSQDARSAFVSSINQGLGGFHTASVDENGLVTLEATGKKGEMTKEQQAFFDVVSEASSLENGLSSFDIVDGNDAVSENIFFGDNGESSISATPGTHTIDIGDAQGLGSDGKLTAQGVIAHEVKEGFEIQVNGRSAMSAHGKGIVAESKSTGTVSLGATINSSRTEIRVPVQRGQQKSTVIMKFRNGNLRKVINNEK